MTSRPLIDWLDALFELLGFLAIIIPSGAIGFRYGVLSRLFARSSAAAEPSAPRRLYDDASARAAALGLAGAVLAAVLAAHGLPGLAARQHVTVSRLLTTNAGAAMQVGFLILSLIGFLLAWRRIGAGWPLAAVGVVLGLLRNGLLGRFGTLINPMHELAAGLWIGTLFVLVVAGVSAVLRDEPARELRGTIVADMVNTFSPLALVSAAVLVLFGVITAWRHLHTLSNLWSTPYGYALIAKLVLVAVVFALGAFNWRRQRPTLGSEGAAFALRRSAKAELTVAGLVLLATAILVSVPSPRPPGARGGAPGEGPPGATPGATPTTPQGAPPPSGG